jgi:hypothetical protein
MRFSSIQMRALAIEDSHFTAWLRHTVQPRAERTPRNEVLGIFIERMGS